MTEHRHREPLPPVVLDIGGDIGALIIHTGSELDDAEIEISPITAPTDRTHNQVHARKTANGIRYSAVFPTVQAADYDVWRDASTRHGQVTIHGGQITEYDFG